jgi:hypothetical protein
VPTVELSIITPPVISAALSSQRNQSNQITHSTVTNSFIHIQSRKQGKSMADEMRLPIFRGNGSEDPNQH